MNAAAHTPFIDAVLGRAGRRIRAQWALRWAGRGLCAVLAASLAWLLAARFGLSPEPPPGALPWLLAAGTAAGAAAGAARRLSRADVARVLDARAGLKERLSTAVWLQTEGRGDALARLQQADAARHAAATDLRAALPLRMPRDAAVTAVVAAALLGALFLPSVPLFWSAARKQEHAEVRRAGAALERAAQKLERSAVAGGLRESRRAALEARRLARALQQGNLDKREAMVRTARLTRQVAEQHRRLAAASGGARSAAAAAGDIPRGGALGGLADAVARQDGEAQRRALEALGEQVRKGSAGPAAQARLAADLAKTARALEGTEMDAAARQMREAAQGLRQANLTAAQRRRLAGSLEKAGAACAACAAAAQDARALADVAATIEANRLALARSGQAGRTAFAQPALPGSARPASAVPGPPVPQPAAGRQGSSGAVPNRPSGQAPGPLDPRRRPDAQVRGQGSPGGRAPTQRGRGGAGTPGQATVPDYAARTSGRQADESAVSRESIPPPVERRVREYFRSIAR